LTCATEIRLGLAGLCRCWERKISQQPIF